MQSIDPDRTEGQIEGRRLHFEPSSARCLRVEARSGDPDEMVLSTPVRIPNVSAE
jgi:hypothetical protein